MRSLLKVPSPAMVVACLALVVALGGTSYAAVTLQSNSVGTAQLKSNAVTSPKIKNGTITKADLSASLAEGQGAIAYGNFSANGGLEGGQMNMKGISMSQISPGIYCLSGFNTSPNSVAATIDATGPEDGATVQASAGYISECPEGAEAEVQTFNAKGARASEGFYAVFF
jgi:hypothetical protein